MTRTLIVTADDVGLHPAITAGAIAAHVGGIVTACSVVAGGAALDDAVNRLAAHPRLAVGIHLTLTGAPPVADPRTVHSLLGSDGNLLGSSAAFLARWARGGIRLDDVERELRAQLDRLQGAGLRIVHANGHQHLHVLPGVFDRVLRLCLAHGIGYVRMPVVGPTRGVPLPRRLALGALSVFASRARASTRERLLTNDATLGIPCAGSLSATAIIEALPGIRGATELVAHPGVDDDALAATFGWGYRWERETAALCDPAVREAIDRNGIPLRSPADLIGNSE